VTWVHFVALALALALAVSYLKPVLRRRRRRARRRRDMARMVANAHRRRSETPSQPADNRILWDVYYGAQAEKTIGTALRYGVFELLAERSASAEDMADRARLGRPFVGALLETLAALGLVRFETDERVSLTDIARDHLLRESPFYLGFLFPKAFEPAMLRAAATDAPLSRAAARWARGRAGGQTAGFAAQMHGRTFAPALAAARLGDFSGVRRLADMAGGSGAMSIALALTHKDIEPVVVDLPEMCAETRRFVADYGLSERVRVQEGDLFKPETWPTPVDGVMFSNIFHDWDETVCRRLAESAFNALAPGGRVYIQEMLLNEGHDGPLATAMHHLSMVVSFRGKQYRASELRAILRDAGFERIAVQPTLGYFSLTSAAKPAEASREGEAGGPP